jgi:hypothetical protein
MRAILAVSATAPVLSGVSAWPASRRRHLAGLVGSMPEPRRVLPVLEEVTLKTGNFACRLGRDDLRWQRVRACGAYRLVGAQHSAGRPALIWGRRRVGKTALIERFASGVDRVVFHTGVGVDSPAQTGSRAANIDYCAHGGSEFRTLMRALIEAEHVVPVLYHYGAGLAGGAHRSSQSATAPIALGKWQGLKGIFHGRRSICGGGRQLRRAAMPPVKMAPAAANALISYRMAAAVVGAWRRLPLTTPSIACHKSTVFKTTVL